MNVSGLLQEAAKQLEASGIEESDLDARLLMEFVTGMSRSELILGAERCLEPSVQDRFFELIKKRSTRIPLQYITESREFWSLDFFVSPAVLIPRPETEFLLEKVLDSIQPEAKSELRVLDMCTGSGVIATVLEKELQCQVAAVDISCEALAVAQKNFSRHCTKDPFVICSDLFSGIGNHASFDLIICNPPYIEHKELNNLEPEVVNFEPHLALDGGSDGFEIIHRVLGTAQQHLKEDGMLFMEIGDGQRQGLLTYLSENAHLFSRGEVLKDWAGKDRVLKVNYQRKKKQRN